MLLRDYEIAVLLRMYDAQIIGKSGYKAVQQVRRNINWSGIARAYSVRKGFDAVARKLVARMLLSDDGKSMKVLYLDKLGATFVVGYMKQNPDALAELDAKMRTGKE